jgi:hypothetical protein
VVLTMFVVVMVIVAMTMMMTLAVFMDVKVDMIFFVSNFSDGNLPRGTTTSASIAHDILICIFF